MTSSTITANHFESTHNPSKTLEPIENLWQQQTPVDKNSTSAAINSSEASVEREREAIATSSEEVDTSQKYDSEAGKSGMYNSTVSARSSGHIDTNASLPAPENAIPASTDRNKLDEHEGGEEEEEDEFKFEDDSEDDSEDDNFPQFEGGEPRGRVAHPIAGPTSGPLRPVRPPR